MCVKVIASCKGGTLFLRHNVVKRLILLPLICLFRRLVNETQQQSSVLYIRLNEQWLDVCLHDIQPVVKPVVQPAVSCKRGIKVTSGSVSVV